MATPRQGTKGCGEGVAFDRGGTDDVGGALVDPRRHVAAVELDLRGVLERFPSVY